MPDDSQPLYLLSRYVSPEWYESFDRYHPADDLLRVARSIIPPTWRLQRSNVWFHARPRGMGLPKQGWKIHVSSLPTDCEEVLGNVATLCVRKETPFKFALDRRLVSLCTYKGWAREASGKFITVYPLDEGRFKDLLEALYKALRQFEGPYVLSDRRYKDARTIYYRYGGMDGFRTLSFAGDQRYMLRSPDGDLIPDWRTPYWNPPPWVSDPLGPEEEESEPDLLTLKDGRYQIERALGFSVYGGVYVATDLDTGNSVVVKEARPGTGFEENGDYAVDRIRKEYRLLHRLSETGVTPTPIDLFEDWEHLFLVEEYVPGIHLGHFTIGHSPLLRTRPEEGAIEGYRERLGKVWANLAMGLAAIHDMGVTCGDLSLTNVIVKNMELGEVCIVDLEAAWEAGVDAPIHLSTPGYREPAWKEASGEADDLYALGSVMLGTLLPINNLLDLDPSVKRVFVQVLGAELGLPQQIRRLVEGALSSNTSDRPSLHGIAEAAHQLLTQSEREEVTDTDRTVSRMDLLRAVRNIASYILASADLQREDRLFPADPLVFYTNPLSVAHGALGVVYALHKVGGEVPKPILSWILSRSVNAEDYPPGLYIGSAGIAWALWEIGLEEVALQTVRAADNHPLLWDVADVYYGAAGYGLVCLRIYLGTREQQWLDRAVQVGEWLLRSKIDADTGNCWPDKEGMVWLGYARGASGIALYLLYLSLATGDDRFLRGGEQALAFDLAQARITEEGHPSIPRGTVGAFEDVLTHYWLDGSAGVATALVRFWASTKNRSYLNALNDLAPDTFRKYTVFPSLFRGLSGLGNFLLDACALTGEERYLRHAHRAAGGVMLFGVERPDGLAFPGEQLYRISTDFATGSAGVALFLHRLAHADRRAGNFNFTLDQLISGQEIGRELS